MPHLAKATVHCLPEAMLNSRMHWGGDGGKELSVCHLALTINVTAARLTWEGLVRVGQSLGGPIRDRLELVG